MHYPLDRMDVFGKFYGNLLWVNFMEHIVEVVNMALTHFLAKRHTKFKCILASMSG